MATKSTPASAFMTGLGRGFQNGVEAARDQRAELVRLRTEASHAAQLRAENAALRAQVQQLQQGAQALRARQSPEPSPQLAQLHRELESTRTQLRAAQAARGVPDTEFLQQRALEAAIENVIATATDYLFVVSPYVKIADALRVSLHAAKRRGVRSVLLCREGHPKDAATAQLVHQLFSQVLEVPSLHAKCYVNRSTAVVASLNLYEFSSQNLEMGIAISHTNPMFNQVLCAVRDYAGVATRRPAPPKASPAPAAPPAPAVAAPAPTAHCIRCATQIARNPARPLCTTCFRSWAEYENVTYVEKHCHGCGSPTTGITFARPLCRTCYRKHG